MATAGQRLSQSASDELMQQILATHAPGGQNFDVRPFLPILNHIFTFAFSVVTVGTESTSKDRQPQAEMKDENRQIDFIAAQSDFIDRIERQISYKALNGADDDETVLSILKMLSSFSWEAKLVLTMAAFALNYGEFWVLAKFYSRNAEANLTAVFRQLPSIMEHIEELMPVFDGVNKQIKCMMDVTECVICLSELPVEDISKVPRSQIPTAVYRTIRSVVACSTKITNLTTKGFDFAKSELWRLDFLAQKLQEIHSDLTYQLSTRKQQLNEKKHLENYQNLLHLYKMAHLDNMSVLKALIYAKDDLQPLVEGSTRRRVNINVLRRKNVLLLISDLDILQAEIVILEQIYSESRQHPSRQESQYEIVWLPILDPTVPFTENLQKKFENLQAGMTWYSIYHPSLIDRAVIKFVKQEWHFGKKPILVVLDPQGRVTSPNALHMLWIWGSFAFPFTTIREEALWKEEIWRVELLVDDIDPTVLNWTQEGRYICLYGGEDMKWIRKFTNAARAVAQAENIPLGMVYVGKSNPKERVRKNIASIREEKLSHYWEDLALIWFFWVRIESMWRSKNQLGRTSENDPIMKEIMIMLTFDSSESGWAIFTRGIDEMVKAKGNIFLTCLSEYTVWKDQIQQIGFMAALRDHLKTLHPEHHCNRLILPSVAAGMIPKRIVCSECGRVMESCLMYKCCDE